MEATQEGLLITSRTGISGFFPDASLREDHLDEIDFPSHPMEFGASINDHRIVLPKKVTLLWQISDHTLNDPITSYAASGADTRSKAAHSFFTQIQAIGDPVSITTNLKNYDNMGIKSISVSQDAETSTVVAMTIQLQELIIVQTKKVKLPKNILATPEQKREKGAPTELVEAEKTQDKASAEEDRGENPAKNPTLERAGKIANFLLGVRALRRLGGF